VSVKVVGLDLSITGTGLAYPSGDGDAVTELIKTNEKAGDARLVQIRETILDRCAGAEFALIEAPTARSASSVISGMVHGVVRLALIDLGVSYGSALPATIKKYATGKGNGNKIPMALEALKRAGREFPDDNQCDAWWAWVMAMDFSGCPVFDLPKVNRESLTKIKMHWKGNRS
jgi:Holliday junction resolvasome RuvABC endonuclease subunit